MTACSLEALDICVSSIDLLEVLFKYALHRLDFSFLFIPLLSIKGVTVLLFKDVRKPRVVEYWIHSANYNYIRWLW